MVAPAGVWSVAVPDVFDLALNRTLSVCVLLAIAAFVPYDRSVKDRLAEQAERAKTAEQITIDVLTILPREIHKPLH